MKKFIVTSLLLLAFLLAGLSLPINTAKAYTSVNGYYRSNGTYVQPYVRSTPNSLRYDNYNYNGSGSLYNKSYSYPTRSYSSSWYTPSYYTDNSYYTGKSIYNNNKYTKPTTRSFFKSFFHW